MVGFVVATSSIVYLIAMELMGRRDALIACLIYMFLPINLKFSYHVQLDAVMNFFLCLGLLFLLRFQGSRRSSYLAVSGFSFAFAILAKLSAAVISVALVLLSLLWFFRDGRGTRTSMIPSILAALVLLPLAAWMGFMSSAFSTEIGSEVLSYSTAGQGKLSLLDLPTFAPKVLDMLGLALIPALLGIRRLLQRDSSRVILVYGASFIGFLILFHKHNYYLMPLGVVVAIAAAAGLGRIVSNQRFRAFLAMILLVSIAQYVVGFALLKPTSPDFREAAKIQFGDADIYIDSPQMGYYLTKKGVHYEPFKRGFVREGIYLLIDRANLDWLLDQVPQAEVVLLGRSDGLTNLRERLATIRGDLDLHKVTISGPVS
jgi:4-amino-4-deoxy-L-arabinose transferase-like glycosyltransferase